MSQTRSRYPPFPWDLDALGRAPATHPAPGYEADGVRALFYEGLPFQGKPTRCFAYMGVPAVAEDRRVPAMVLVHGGGGQAFPEWVRIWNRRGYAAVAMDLCGSLPEEGTPGRDLPRHEFSGPRGWAASFAQIDGPVEDQWQVHAIGDIMLAHSLLASLPEVDAGRVGLTGISWGGYLTCIAAGADPRFRLAVPVYGCGFLGDNSAWLSNFSEMGPERAGKWLRQWDPSVFLPHAAMPLLWVAGTNDGAYPMDSLRKSYRLPKGPRTLCIRVAMAHGHVAGWSPNEIGAFADSILGDGPPLATVSGQGVEARAFRVRFKCVVPVARAELCFTEGSGPWKERKWQAVPAKLDAAAGEAEAEVPSAATVAYINLIEEAANVVSSEHVEFAD